MGHKPIVFISLCFLIPVKPIERASYITLSSSAAEESITRANKSSCQVAEL